MHAGSGPTRRETFLLIILLVTLLSFSSLNFTLGGSRSTFLGGYGDKILSSGSNTEDSTTELLRSRMSWAEGAVPHTDVLAHVPGWTIFDNLYVFNGTVYIVTDKPASVPDRSHITSTAVKIANGATAIASRLPTDKELRVISSKEARSLFGTKAEIIDGVSWLINDPPQFITHYYHWSAELFFGFWRTYSSLDPSVPSTGNTSLPAMRRIVFSHADADHWRDYALMNQWVLRSVFPSIALEFNSDWQDRAQMGVAYVFDRVVFSDRAAAMHGSLFQSTGRTASEPSALAGSVHWWSTVRKNVIQLSGLSGDTGPATTRTPVITYISRQEWGRRMLIPEDHDRLVQELYKLRDNYGYEVNVVSMDKLSRTEQIQLAARTTIMMGVHGNGLTSLVWMKPSPRTTVMEFFFPGGFAHDYEYTSRALGMTHYGFWNDHTFTSPDTPKVAYPEGFQGTKIPIDGAAVARLCVERLSLANS